MRNKILLALSLIAALVAAALVYYYLDNLKKTYREIEDFRTVVTAATRIPAKTMVKKEMLEVKEIPVRYISENAVTATEDALGKITKSEILPGEVLRSEKLSGTKEGRDGLAYSVTPGKRAVTVSVNDVTGVAGLLRTGDRIDVLGTIDAQTGSGQEKASSTSFLIQNIEILSLDQTYAVDESSVQTNQGGYKNVTLLVTPQQALPLVLCSQKGSIWFALRAPVDEDIVDLPPVKVSDLIN